MIRLIRGIELGLILVGFLVTGAWAVEGDVVYKKSGGERQEAPAVFPHWIHRIRYKCYACHPPLFDMSQSVGKVTHDVMKQGKFCGACHNGKLAWEMAFDTCARCHAETGEVTEPVKKDDKKEPSKKEEKKEPAKKDEKKEPVKEEKKDDKKEPPKKDEPAKKDDKKEPAKKEEPAKKDDKKEPAKKEEPAKKDEKKEPAKKEEPAKKDEKKEAPKQKEPVETEDSLDAE